MCPAKVWALSRRDGSHCVDFRNAMASSDFHFRKLSLMLQNQSIRGREINLEVIVVVWVRHDKVGIQRRGHTLETLF